MQSITATTTATTTTSRYQIPNISSRVNIGIFVPWQLLSQLINHDTSVVSRYFCLVVVLAAVCVVVVLVFFTVLITVLVVVVDVRFEFEAYRC